jgi:hypothetical protein
MDIDIFGDCAVDLPNRGTTQQQSSIYQNLLTTLLMVILAGLSYMMRMDATGHPQNATYWVMFGLVISAAALASIKLNLDAAIRGGMNGLFMVQQGVVHEAGVVDMV